MAIFGKDLILKCKKGGGGKSHSPRTMLCSPACSALNNIARFLWYEA